MGRPNVGKSTLFNRLSKQVLRKSALRQPALVSPDAGTTRDRLEYSCEWAGLEFRVQDTGGVVGLDGGKGRSALESAVEQQVREAVRLAGVVLFMVDARAGVTGADQELARILRRLDKPVLLAANKVETPDRQREEVAEFWSLGLGEPRPLSALHGTGSGELLDLVVAALQEQPVAVAQAPEWPATVGEAEVHRDALSSTSELKLAVVGQPNSGKSSLLNALLNEERLVVHTEPGTTRDPISLPLSWAGERLLVADTAGIRRHAAGGPAREDLDRQAVARAQQTIQNCHVALLLIDAAAGLTRQDQRIAEQIVTNGKGCVLVGNKSDLLSGREWHDFESEVRAKLAMLAYAPLVRASVLRGEGIGEAMDLVLEAGRWRRERLHKKVLNTVVQEAQLLRPLPLTKTGGAQKVLHVRQADGETPTIVMRTNRVVDLHPSDVKYLENAIREQWPFTATPLRLLFELNPPSPRSAERMRKHTGAAQVPRWQKAAADKERRAAAPAKAVAHAAGRGRKRYGRS